MLHYGIGSLGCQWPGAWGQSHSWLRWRSPQTQQLKQHRSVLLQRGRPKILDQMHCTEAICQLPCSPASRGCSGLSPGTVLRGCLHQVQGSQCQGQTHNCSSDSRCKILSIVPPVRKERDLAHGYVVKFIKLSCCGTWVYVSLDTKWLLLRIHECHDWDIVRASLFRNEQYPPSPILKTIRISLEFSELTMVSWDSYFLKVNVTF